MLYRNINHCHVKEKPKVLHASGKNQISYISSDQIVTSQKYCTVQHMHMLLCLGNPRKKCNTLCGYVHSECPNHTYLTLFQVSLNSCALTLSTFAQNNPFPSCSCSLDTLPSSIHELYSPLPSAVFLMLEKLKVKIRKKEPQSHLLWNFAGNTVMSLFFQKDGKGKRYIRPKTCMWCESCVWIPYRSIVSILLPQGFLLNSVMSISTCYPGWSDKPS